jgi:hypothetical protein
VAVVVGENAILLVAVPVDAIQVYVLAPPPVRVIGKPVHTWLVVVLAVTVGRGITVTTKVSESTQPTALVPVAT